MSKFNDKFCRGDFVVEKNETDLSYYYIIESVFIEDGVEYCRLEDCVNSYPLEWFEIYKKKRK